MANGREQGLQDSLKGAPPTERNTSPRRLGGRVNLPRAAGGQHTKEASATSQYKQPPPRVNSRGHSSCPMDLSPSTADCPRVVHPGVSGGKTLHYTPILQRHRIPSVRDRFVQLDADAETRAFLKNYCTDTESIIRDGLAHALRWMGWSLTDVNGMLGRGQMFVCSHAHVCRLLSASGWDSIDFARCRGHGSDASPSSSSLGSRAKHVREGEAGSLLDVGAGDGTVTSTALASLVGFAGKRQDKNAGECQRGGTIVTTEVSGPMVSCLRGRGFVCHETVDLRTCKELLPAMRGRFDIVSCLNVLDRADRPQRLLEDLRSLVQPDSGRVILAVVLPFCPFVESGSRQLRPSETLPMKGGLCKDGAYFEWSVDAMISQVLEPSGFCVHAWSQLPYLCSGDRAAPYYVLYDAVFVMSVPSDVVDNGD